MTAPRNVKWLLNQRAVRSGKHHIKQNCYNAAVTQDSLGTFRCQVPMFIINHQSERNTCHFSNLFDHKILHSALKLTSRTGVYSESETTTITATARGEAASAPPVTPSSLTARAHRSQDSPMTLSRERRLWSIRNNNH